MNEIQLFRFIMDTIFFYSELFIYSMFMIDELKIYKYESHFEETTKITEYLLAVSVKLLK